MTTREAIKQQILALDELINSHVDVEYNHGLRTGLYAAYICAIMMDNMYKDKDILNTNLLFRRPSGL